jgi:hypothetical protein
VLPKLKLNNMKTFSGIEIKTTDSDKNTVSATEVKFRGKAPPGTRALEPLPHKYKGMPLSVSMAPEHEASNLTDVSEK